MNFIHLVTKRRKVLRISMEMKWLAIVSVYLALQTVLAEDHPFFLIQNKLDIGQHVSKLKYLGVDIDIYQFKSENETAIYYFTPLSILDRSSLTTNNTHISFTVDMWNETMKLVLIDQLNFDLNDTIQLTQIEPVPFERVILTSGFSRVRNDIDYSPDQDWTPFSSSVHFNLKCVSRSCAASKNYNSLFDQFRLAFDIGQVDHKPMEEETMATISKYNLIMANADIFWEMNETFTEVDKQLILINKDLTDQILQKMIFAIVNEISTTTVGVQFKSRQIIRDRLIQTLFVNEPTTIGDPEDERWRQVYWKDTPGRPDLIVRQLNDQLRLMIQNGSSNQSIEDFLIQKTTNNCKSCKSEEQWLSFNYTDSGPQFTIEPIVFNSFKFHFLFGDESSDELVMESPLVISLFKSNWTSPIRDHIDTTTKQLQTSSIGNCGFLGNYLNSSLMANQSIVVRLKSSFNGEFLYPATNKYLFYDQNRRGVFTWRDKSISDSHWVLKGMATPDSDVVYFRMEPADHSDEYLYATDDQSLYGPGQRGVYTNRTTWYDHVDDESFLWLLDCQNGYAGEHLFSLRNGKYSNEYLVPADVTRDSHRRSVSLQRFVQIADQEKGNLFFWDVEVVGL